ncbi:Mono-functional DNA-alkylating methyl methanesulfonate N-term domain containing protein [Naviculisporaceae sp. PSN 640]
MAFQTSVLRDGAWVTETVDLQTLLKANNSAKEAKKAHQLIAPICGILSQTVIDSQLVNFILPVRLRSRRHNDVAFIKDRSIQIFELQEDSRLVEIAAKNDFGIRIRNAAVFGTFNINDNGHGQEGGLPKFGWSSPPTLTGNTSQLPPQQLLLVLESGMCVFLFLEKGPDGTLEFRTHLYRNPMPKSLYMGFHLAVDPSSRYMASASHQEHLIIFELDSYEDQNSRYLRKAPLTPIRYWCPRSIQGVIHKVVFLHPNPEHPNHVILLIIVVKNGKSWMVIYDWEPGENLRSVFEKEKRGYRMPPETQMPLLVIPLTVRSAFVTISADNYTAVWTGALHGSPTPEEMVLKNPPPTNIHYGKNAPLWTAWLRPLRLSPYLKEKDCIYLAREDGVVVYIDADGDAELIVHEMATFNCNISSAFACVFHECTDALLVGSDSGPGEVWKVPPRQELPQLSILPAGAPTIDFVTTDESRSWRQAASSVGRHPKNQELQARRPDRIFTASGCGTKGAIAEYRYGLKAEVELEFEYGPGIKHAWLFPSRFDGSSPGFDLLISLPDTTGALHFDEGLEEASHLDPNLVPYELLSTTLALEYTDSLLVQITPASVVLATHDRRAKFSFDDILKHGTRFTVSDASILNGSIACSVYVGSRYHIAVFSIDLAHLSLVPQQTFEVDGEVSCLTITDEYVVAGVWKDDKAFLATCVRSPSPPPIQMRDIPALLASSDGFDAHRQGSPDALEPIASIVYVNDSIFLGTRSGEVVTLSSLHGDLTADIQKFGMTTAYITSHRNFQTLDAGPTVLVCCDGRLVHIQQKFSHRPLTDSGSRAPGRFQTHQIFPLDEGNLGAPADEVNFAVAVDLVSADFQHVLMASGPKLLLTKLNLKPGLVHRRISVSGAPTRIMYSPKLRCLVTAVNWDGKATLRFIDPDTGEDLGQPVDKHKNPIEFISGLGKSGDTVYGLEEWKYEKDGSVWEYILVSTRLGRLIVVDTEKISVREDGRKRINYWARFTHKEDAPIYSVIGGEEGLIYCAGSTLYWFILDTEAKKLKRLKSFNLASPATSLQMANGKLMALTSRDSLLVVDPGDNSPSLCHADPKPRNATHMIELAGPRLGDPLSTITLVADRDSGIGGMWVPWQSPQKDCLPLFEADLAASVRRFRRGRARPPWERSSHQQKYGRFLSTLDDADIMSVSLDGSLRHFTLLEMNYWRLLRFIQNLVQTSVDLCPFTHFGALEPFDFKMEGLDMHVDGDLLRRCLETRGLERLLGKPIHVEAFMELVDSLDNGKHAASARSADDAEKFRSYVLLAYDIMEYFLQRPL